MAGPIFDPEVSQTDGHTFRWTPRRLKSLRMLQVGKIKEAVPHKMALKKIGAKTEAPGNKPERDPRNHSCKRTLWIREPADAHGNEPPFKFQTLTKHETPGMPRPKAPLTRIVIRPWGHGMPMTTHGPTGMKAGAERRQSAGEDGIRKRGLREGLPGSRVCSRCANCSPARSPNCARRAPGVVI